MLQRVVLRRRLRPIAARAAEVLRLVDHLGLHLHLGAIGLDHDEARAFEDLFGIDTRLLGAWSRGGRGGRDRLIHPGLLLNRLGFRDRVRQGLPGVFSPRLQLVNALLLHYCICRLRHGLLGVCSLRLQLMNAPLLLRDCT